PDTIPNSEVKRCNADGSVGLPHVRVGHRQVTKYISKLNKKEEPRVQRYGVFVLLEFTHYLIK
ncbi:MAG: hypothetical protein E7K78_07635, partial [Haemophilus haemolyticus]|nr:hypothetical protein [Haemophilus haemolyticus]